MARLHVAAFFLSILAACGEPCDEPIDTEAVEQCNDCLPTVQGQPYGPCDPEVGCTDHAANVCLLGDGADVCAKTCHDEADCAAVLYCVPGEAQTACISAWCVVPCDLSTAPTCPSGMACDTSTMFCMWPG